MGEETRSRSLGKRFRDALIYGIARALLFVGGFIPAWLGHWLGAGFGALAYLLARRDRAMALGNLRLAYGEELREAQRRRITRGMFVNYGRILFEVLKIPRLSARRAGRGVSFRNLEVVREAVRSGQGVVIATGHIGNWEIMGAAASKLGLPVNVIARRIRDRRLNDLVIGLRAKAGVKTILRESPDSAKEILRCLRRGELLALLIDQDIKAEGEFVPFFGVQAYTPLGAAALAQRTGALLVAAATERIGAGRHCVSAEPIPLKDSRGTALGAVEVTARATARLESWIRRRPEQWCWNHNRWRSSPDAGGREGNQIQR